MKNIYLLFVLLFLGMNEVTAQDFGRQDSIVIYLKKGMRFKGYLLDHKPGVSTTMLSRFGDTIVVEDHLVSHFHFPQERKKRARKARDRGYFKDEGFYQVTNVGILANTISSEAGGLTGFELSAAAGVMKNRMLGFGAGVGADFYHNLNSERIFPLFGEVRGYFQDNPTSVFYAVRAGYGFAFADSEVGIRRARGGVMVNPSVGWRLGGGAGLKMTLEVGLKFQNAEFEFRNNGETSVMELGYKRLGVRLGFLL